MPLNIVTPGPNTKQDAIEAAGASIQNTYNGLNRLLVSSFVQVINQVAGNSAFTQADFWAAQGTGGAALLTTLGEYKAFIMQQVPSGSLPSAILTAGNGLSVSSSGTVTVG